MNVSVIAYNYASANINALKSEIGRTYFQLSHHFR